MGLLSRFHKLAFVLSLLVALFLIPVTGSIPSPGHWLCATPAWAGGSPDETLNPRPNPATGRTTSSGVTQDRPTVDGISTSLSPARAIHRTGRMTWTDRWALVWRIYLASMLRI